MSKEDYLWYKLAELSFAQEWEKEDDEYWNQYYDLNTDKNINCN